MSFSPSERTMGRRKKVDKQSIIAKEGNPSANISFKVLYEAEQRKVEELEKHELELNKQLHLAYGKIEVYENLLKQQHAAEPTEAMLCLSPRTAQRCIPLANAAPDHHHNILTSPKGKKKNQKATPDVLDVHKSSPSKNKVKYRKKNAKAATPNAFC